MTKGTIYKVEFAYPPLEDDDRTEFFFTSLSAIYEVFSVEQIGCGVRRLWNLKVPSGETYYGKKCSIYKEEFTRKTRNNPDKGRTQNVQ